MAVLDDVKALLGFDKAFDSSQLQTIINLTESRLKALLGVDSVPAELEYIETEVAVRRFNRIGSEGASTHIVEGESWIFSDNDFEAFASDIQAWRSKQEEQTMGKVRFL